MQHTRSAGIVVTDVVTFAIADGLLALPAGAYRISSCASGGSSANDIIIAGIERVPFLAPFRGIYPNCSTLPDCRFRWLPKLRHTSHAPQLLHLQKCRRSRMALTS